MSELYVDISDLKMTMDQGDVRLYATMEQLAELHQLALTAKGRNTICVDIIGWLAGHGRKQAVAAIKEALDAHFTDDEIEAICEELKK